jgi:hypothetical protein
MKAPPPSRLRVTVSVTPETLAVFQHYAEASGVSVGRAMGDWLGEQLSAVQFAALRFEEVRTEVQEAPRLIAEQLTPEGSRQAAASAGARSPGAAARYSPPRPVIRGGNSPRRGTE